MVVLSRNRPLQKAVPKLSVPPPLNLPSLRKEYEKTDSSGAGGGVAGGAGSGSGSRPSSSGMGWTKPGNVALQEKEVSETQVLESLNYTEVAVTKGSGTYMPPLVRFGGGIGHGDTGLTHRLNVAFVDRAMGLRGEDFPSLRAALPPSNGPAQKQKERSFQKPKQLGSEELSSNDLKNSSHFSLPAHIQSSNRMSNGVNENNGRSPSLRSVYVDHARKQEDPFPLIRLNPRSDWADDERDTGYVFAGRSSRDQELPKSETYWDGVFDVPRSNILPHKLFNNLSERHVQPVVVKGSTSDVLKTEPFRREINLHSREDVESNSWRRSSVHKDKPTGPHAINEGNIVTLPDRFSNGHHTQGRQGGQKHWSLSVETPRYRNEGYQNSAGAKSFFSSGTREKSSFSKNERTYVDEPYLKDFSSSVNDEGESFTGNLVGVAKRKKEVSKQVDFHDPDRESFEAELERVQKMQEMERHRVVEEQERALEQAQREDEERRRVILEEEERRRRMEEEAQEASWRAEQERLDAIQKAEELRISREEEKKRMNLEEERRKQAAKQKLLELEAKMAKREAEDGKSGTPDEEVPIVTPTVDTDVKTGIRSHMNKTLQRGSTSGVLEDNGSNLMFETENKVVDNVPTSSNDWGNARMDQQVIPLTQTQLDEAMKPLRFNATHITSIGDHTTLVNEPILSSSLVSTKGKSVSSCSSPINPLLAGEKIQFGSFISPTVLPPSSRVVSHVIGSFRSGMTQNNSKAENDSNIFFKKEGHSTEDCKSEVEVVSVAAVDTDGIVGIGMGPISVPVEGIQGVDQSMLEEPFSVSLPADLSVETPPISLWPPLPSPQGSSSQMLSHFHGPTPYSFPFYEMNFGHPMMSAPVFAFGPHQESGGTQSQPQKITGPSNSRHIGGPSQSHSGMDSFYAQPAGSPGPFIGSPSVQAPPHMVVYNHYAPVGQFGQVGLSFMGATYIPSGKQPDWKHDPTSSASGRGEEGPRNLPNMQHLAPGSPLMPMGSPLTMFDLPPFQTAPDMSVHGGWSASPLHSVPMSLPLQQQAEAMTGPGSSQFSSQSAFPHNRFSELQTCSTLSNSNGTVFPVLRDSTITHFPDELGMVDSSEPSVSTSSIPANISHISSGTTKSGDGVQRCGISNQHHPQVVRDSTITHFPDELGMVDSSGPSISTSFVPATVSHISSGTTKTGDGVQRGGISNQHHQKGCGGGSGYGYQRGGGVSPKNKSVGQWAHRRTGGRYQSNGQEKSFAPSSKVKQIYVAKQADASGGSSSNVG